MLTKRKTVIPMMKVASDMFKCSSCGYVVRIRVLGDVCKCSKCGGTMRRL